MLDHRGQQIGEYAVLLGMVASAFLATQMVMSRAIGGGLVGISQQVLGDPADAEGSNDANTITTVQETGSATGTRTRLTSELRGTSAAGHILAEAYGPYIGVYLSTDSGSTTLYAHPYTLAGFFDTDVLSGLGELPGAGLDAIAEKIENDPDLRVADANGDGVNDVLLLDTNGDGKPDLIVLNVTDALTDAKAAAGLTAGWRALVARGPAKALVTVRNTMDWDAKEEEIESGEIRLPDAVDDADVPLEDTPENRKYETLKAFLLNYMEELASASGAHLNDTTAEQRARYSQSNIKGELGKVDLSSLSVQEIKDFLQEASDPESETYQRLAADGVFDAAGAGVPRLGKVELLDRLGQVVISNELDEMDLMTRIDQLGGWQTGEQYAGGVVYEDGDEDGRMYGIQLASDPTGTKKGSGKLEIWFEDTDSNLAGDVGLPEKMQIIEDGRTREEPLFTRRTYKGGFDEQGRWDESQVTVVQDHEAVTPFVSLSQGDRRPDAGLMEWDEATTRELQAAGQLPEGATSVFFADANGNGVLERSDLDAAQRNPTFAYHDWKVLLPGEAPTEVLATDVPTAQEMLASHRTSLEGVILYHRFNPESVPAEARGKVPSGVTREALLEAMRLPTGGGLVNRLFDPAKQALGTALISTTFTEMLPAELPAGALQTPDLSEAAGLPSGAPLGPATRQSYGIQYFDGTPNVPFTPSEGY